jgi:predicted transcriptional regulator
MKKLNINQLDKKKKEIADALICLSLGRPAAKTLAYLIIGMKPHVMHLKWELDCVNLKSFSSPQRFN